jgi:hypothetical protein
MLCICPVKHLKASAHRTRPSAAARPLSMAASPRGLVRAYTKRPTAGGRRSRFSLQRSVEWAKGLLVFLISNLRRVLNIACNLLGCFPSCGV